jgi:hypothetical protein
MTLAASTAGRLPRAKIKCVHLTKTKLHNCFLDTNTFLRICVYVVIYLDFDFIKISIWPHLHAVRAKIQHRKMLESGLQVSISG